MLSGVSLRGCERKYVRIGAAFVVAEGAGLKRVGVEGATHFPTAWLSHGEWSTRASACEVRSELIPRLRSLSHPA